MKAEWTPFECPGCRERYADAAATQSMIVCRKCWPVLSEALRDAWLRAAGMADSEAAARRIVKHYGIAPLMSNSRRMSFPAAHIGPDIAALIYASPYRTADPRAFAYCLWCGIQDRASAMCRFANGYYCAECAETADEDAPPERDELIALFGQPSHFIL